MKQYLTIDIISLCKIQKNVDLIIVSINEDEIAEYIYEMIIYVNNLCHICGENRKR